MNESNGQPKCIKMLYPSVSPLSLNGMAVNATGLNPTIYPLFLASDQFLIKFFSLCTFHIRIFFPAGFQTSRAITIASP